MLKIQSSLPPMPAKSADASPCPKICRALILSTILAKMKSSVAAGSAKVVLVKKLAKSWITFRLGCKLNVIFVLNMPAKAVRALKMTVPPS